jgi:hypothetical protein
VNGAKTTFYCSAHLWLRLMRHFHVYQSGSMLPRPMQLVLCLTVWSDMCSLLY